MILTLDYLEQYINQLYPAVLSELNHACHTLLNFFSHPLEMYVALY